MSFRPVFRYVWSKLKLCAKKSCSPDFIFLNKIKIRSIDFWIYVDLQFLTAVSIILFLKKRYENGWRIILISGQRCNWVWMRQLKFKFSMASNLQGQSRSTPELHCWWTFFHWIGNKNRISHNAKIYLIERCNSLPPA